MPLPALKNTIFYKKDSIGRKWILRKSKETFNVTVVRKISLILMEITDLAPMHDIESSDIKYLLVKKFRNAYVWVQDASFSDIYASKRANERREPFQDLHLSLFLSCCFYSVKVVVIFNFSTLTLSLLVRHTVLRGIPFRQWSCITNDLGVKSEALPPQSNFGIPANQGHDRACRPCCSRQ